jgi:glycosyltransferase involved in cell wall biosynthesis
LTVVPNAIDIHHFSIKNTPKQKKFHILHISKFDDERKNVRGILSVFEKICEVYDNVFLEIGGDGDVDWLKDAIDSYIIPSDQITISGVYDYNNFPPVFSNADVFVLFSHFENFGLVLAESILCGTPVISTNVGGVSDIINEKNGVLIEPANEDELYKAMEAFINLQITFDSQQVRNTILDYVSYESVGKAYDEIYKKFLHS